jgi:hypothetical protein
MNLVFASESEKETKIIQIFAAQKVNEQIQTQLDYAKGEQFELFAKRIFNKTLSGHPEASKITNEKASELLVQFMKKCTEGVTTESVLKDAAKIYGESLTDQDVDLILAYYQSTVGKKDVAATVKISAFIGSSILQIMSDQFDKQLPALIKDLDKAATNQD